MFDQKNDDEKGRKTGEICPQGALLPYKAGFVSDIYNKVNREISIVQPGFTTTRITITIINNVGASFAILKVLLVLVLASASKSFLHREKRPCTAGITRTRNNFK